MCLQQFTEFFPFIVRGNTAMCSKQLHFVPIESTKNKLLRETSPKLQGTKMAASPHALAWFLFLNCAGKRERTRLSKQIICVMLVSVHSMIIQTGWLESVKKKKKNQQKGVYEKADKGTNMA
jgi:hypothetical protein